MLPSPIDTISHHLETSRFVSEYPFGLKEQYYRDQVDNLIVAIREKHAMSQAMTKAIKQVAQNS